MSSPKCSSCGRGLSHKHRVEFADARLLMAIFNETLCKACYIAKYPNHYSADLFSKPNQ
jgi:hypothetical protein